MECISYINDLNLEIKTLKDIRDGGFGDIEDINEKIQVKEKLLEKCKKNLAMLSGQKIEYRIYLKILEGKKPSKAIEEISEENYLNDLKPTDISTLWTKYYKNLKKILKTK